MPTEKKQLQYKKKEGSCSWEYWNYFVTFHKIELGKGGTRKVGWHELKIGD